MDPAGSMSVFGLRRGKLVVLSPHLDDAALSLGGTLLTLSRSHPIVVWNVFSRSRASRYRTLRGGRIVEPWRRMEETVASLLLGVSVRFLGFPEAMLRGHRDPRRDAVNATDLQVLQQVRHRLSSLLTGEGVGVLLVPLGVGSHVDHVLVREAAKGLLSQDGGRSPAVVMYEDLPYVEGTDSFEWLATVGGSCEAMYVDISPAMVRKLLVLRIYRTQVGPNTIRRVQKHATKCWMEKHPDSGRRGYCERLWLPTGPRGAGSSSAPPPFHPLPTATFPPSSARQLEGSGISPRVVTVEGPR